MFARRCATIRSRSQPSARGPYGRAYGEFCKRCRGGFKRRIAPFRVASVALCDIQTSFITCQKSFCVAGAIILRCYQTMSCIFGGRRSTLETSIVISRGKHSTLNVSCGSFSANRIVVAGMAICEM